MIYVFKNFPLLVFVDRNSFIRTVLWIVVFDRPHSNYYSSQSESFWKYHLSWMHNPDLNTRLSPAKVCYGYKQKGRYLSECPNRNKYCRWFQFICHIANAVAYFPSNEDVDADKSSHIASSYFLDAEDQLLHGDVENDEPKESLDAYAANLFT